MINIENISFSYIGEDKKVLTDISINIPKGDITTILGLNGSGKTTLIKLMASILKPNNGKIKVNGNDLANLTIKERSKLIAYVPQLVKVEYDFIVFDYLSFSLVNQIEGFRSPSKEQKEKIIEVAKQFKIETLLDKKINNLSGGERQIVSICSAFIQETPIIIFDEPTSALDLKNQAIVIKIIKEWNKRKEKTFILSTHNPNHALSLGGHTVILHDNRVLSYGISRDILTVKTLIPVYGDIIDYASNIAYKVITTKD
ncbi:MAG: ABC transporter ATP-binding protein [Bacteroidales bacterium]|nr:ABC transporter ATP-binding protein [Bacteroidales bacterium]